LPPIDEQRKIGQFLDRKTTLIDSLIEKTVRKIELLKEKRTSLINEVVTKGLNPDVEMKDSGVEWIGEIPSHWDINQLNRVTSKIANGYVGPTRGVMKSSGIKYIQGIHVENGFIEFTPDGDYYVTEEWSNDHSKSILHEGDVVMIQTGSIGQVGYVTKELEGANCHALIILRFSHLFGVGKYLLYFLMSEYSRHTYRLIKTGEILEHLNSTKVKYMKISLPPIVEQRQIGEYLDEQTSIIDSTITTEEKRIELLKEYRQSLISEVVTGKVKVKRDE
jgi:type I restriction enzyme S subunit